MDRGVHRQTHSLRLLGERIALLAGQTEHRPATPLLGVHGRHFIRRIDTRIEAPPGRWLRQLHHRR